MDLVRWQDDEVTVIDIVINGVKISMPESARIDASDGFRYGYGDMRLAVIEIDARPKIDQLIGYFPPLGRF